MSRIAVSLSIAASFWAVGNANAEPTARWWSGFGQGVSEYGYNDGNGSSIYIACDSSFPEYRKFGATIRVAIEAIDPAPGSEVTFFIGKDSFRFIYDSKERMITTASHVDAGNFTALIDALKRGQTVSFAIEDRIGNRHLKTFPLRGSSKALADVCSADFYK